MSFSRVARFVRSLCSGGEKGNVAVMNGASIAPAHKTVISAGRIVILYGREEEKGGTREGIERENELQRMAWLAKPAVDTDGRVHRMQP